MPAPSSRQALRNCRMYFMLLFISAWPSESLRSQRFNTQQLGAGETGRQGRPR
jgi:hypothetical protein